METLPPDQRRLFLRDLQEIELRLMGVLVDNPTWLSKAEESTLRWALSLARLSVVPKSQSTTDAVELGRSSDNFRRDLHAILSECTEKSKVNREVIRAQIPTIHKLTVAERKQLLWLFGDRLSPAELDASVRRRPFCIALGGGGGTGFVFVGALAALEEAGLVPSMLTGTSMGALLGAFRARTRDFDLKGIESLVSRISYRKVFRLFDTASKFGLPATLKLYLREVIGAEFERDGRFLRMSDLEIPLRVCVTGITHPEPSEQINQYAHLLDEAATDATRFRNRAATMSRAILDVARKPMRPIYIGGDDLTKEFDVLDAVGFSVAVPGVIHYDILRDDPRMVELVEKLLVRESAFRLVDGGLTDNLPSYEAMRAVQSGQVKGRDPFILALDSFAPRVGRHLLFLPFMRLAAENSRRGRRVAHLSLRFRKVLSPISVVPTEAEFFRAIENGREEIRSHVPLIRKMVGPIPDPPGLCDP
jgi:predicted acylesterase/phospholipase RssA